MHRSHSRATSPFDKPIPRGDIRRWRAWCLCGRHVSRAHYSSFSPWRYRHASIIPPWRRKRHSIGDAVMKRMHIRKQRQYNKRLLRQYAEQYEHS